MNTENQHPPNTTFDLSSCSLCPRRCQVDRHQNAIGYCACDDALNVHSVVRHQGEEPAISGEHGISNVFFNHCNLQCTYCQNYQISNNTQSSQKQMSLSQVIVAIQKHLDQGAKGVGFVSPSHLIPQMCTIMDALQANGYHPTYVMNTNAYDRVEVLKALASRIDVYLPDFKYMDTSLAARLSGAENYPAMAREALQEMFRQKGSQLVCDTDGVAKNGLIIRHLVLPGYIENTLNCLRYIAQELSPDIHISLMSQYHPNARQSKAPLDRGLYEKEYDLVINEMTKLGLESGWLQALESKSHWNPDFEAEHPFEKEV